MKPDGVSQRASMMGNLRKERTHFFDGIRGKAGKAFYVADDSGLSGDVLKLSAAVGQYLRGIRQSFAGEALKGPLGGQERHPALSINSYECLRMNGQRKGGDAEQYLKSLIMNWLPAHRNELLAGLIAALAATYLRSYNDAVHAWLKSFGYRHCTKARAPETMEEWVRERSQTLTVSVEDLVREEAMAALHEMENENLSYQEKVRRLEELFASSDLTERITQTLSEPAAYEGRQKGAYDLHRLLGAAEKSWQTQEDWDVCVPCFANQRAFEIPLLSPFPSGHLAPPAHNHCRCSCFYFGVSQGSIEKALAELSVVCSIEP